MTERIHWGIIGTGNIARQFATGLQSVPNAQLIAVGSRKQESADRFGDEFDVPHRHTSYPALADDSDVDVIYIATPHNYHRDNAILCLNAGKHVLCEKPFTVNAQEAEEVIQLARKKGLFVMEAMWTRFFPVMVKLRELLAEGSIGDVMLVQSDFGFRMETIKPQHRLFNPAFAGGALLDVGIYPIALASMIFGQPQRIATLTHLGETGVDELSAMVFAYEDSRMAIASAAIRLQTPHEARICGTTGRIHIPDFWHPAEFTLFQSDQKPQTATFPLEGNGYNYEAAEVGKCIRSGRLESDVMPLDETLELMQTLDRIRAEWGLRYPME